MLARSTLAAAWLFLWPGCGAPSLPTPVAPPRTERGDFGPHPAKAAVAKAERENLVRAELIADVAAVRPKETFAVAVRFVVVPGWHIYWENPGEAGLATTVDFTAPPGFAVGAPRYPGPVRFQAPGPIVSYGYSGEVLLSAPVAAPASLPRGGGVRFSAQARWLACRQECIPGRRLLQLHLPLADARQPEQPAHRRQFAAHRDRLPRPFSQLAGARSEWRRSEGVLQLTLAAPGARLVDFFPAADNQLFFVGRDAAPAGQAFRLTYRVPEAAAQASGVLAVARGTKTRYYSLELALPAEPH